MNRKTILAIIIITALVVLGALNIYKKITWKEPSDGVFWEEKPEGITALKVEIDSPAYLAGIKKGDILYSINNILTKNKIDVSKNLWLAGLSDQKVTYQINREGELLFPSFYLAQKGVNLIYFYLALIGLTTIAISIIVLINSKRPFSVPYVFFFYISLAFYSFYIFSPTGEMNFLDNVFYWLDEVAFLVFPPLLFHFFIIFPRRKKNLRKILSSIYWLYLPGGMLLIAKIFIHLPNYFNFNDNIILRFHQTSDKLDLCHFALFSLITLGIIFNDNLRASNLIIKKQLKWIVYGVGIGIIPFFLFYVIPFLFGQVPSKAAELTVVFQAIIPLTFAYSISRYRLVDLEFILKKAVTLISSYVVIGILYFIVSSQTKIFSENRLNVLILGILAIVLGATLFSPIKKLIQSLLDRAIYKRSYKYRKTLLSISQEISRERNLQKLSQSLLELIANALELEHIALLLTSDHEPSTFYVLKSRGKTPPPGTRIPIQYPLFQHLKNAESVSYYTLTEKRELQREFQKLSSFGFFHFMPLRVEDKFIGCLGMGKKADDTFLKSEDWELLRTISSSVALALENAYLYNQAHSRAMELERLKDYSENIIESLTVGVAVLDQKGKIIGWNRIMEETFSQKKEEVLGKRMINVLGEKNFSSLFPSDTQHDFRLLSEISLDMPSGQKKIFDIAKTPLLDNRMNPYGTVIVFEDVTEKISLQQQLLTSEKLASIGLLSAGVAHEINTPLTGISSYVQILQKKLNDSPNAQILEKIEMQTERVARIVKNLLNLSRNPAESSFHPVNIKECLEEIVSLIDYKLKNMNINLELDLSSIKPIWAQGEKLQQVFINILLNAIDAMPNGGKLKIQLSQIENSAVIKIQDTGIGIKPQYLPHIFDPFFTTKGIGKGTGLGLSISYAVIKEHEGNITVESEAERGSLFTIYIPMNLDERKRNNSLIS
ncbi:MAG: GAF domain-containing protein [Candidatus Aminicenantes bacterium]|nr:GAF domain-containing protein [Candidatus Aminicenantes bacterium]